MQPIFINHTNHVSEKWSATQRHAAEAYGTIVDVPFPNIPPQWNEAEVQRMARSCADTILAMNPAAVLCQGEFTYVYALIQLLRQQHILVLAACSERVSEEYIGEDGISHRISRFQFVQFRQYGKEELYG